MSAPVVYTSRVLRRRAAGEDQHCGGDGGDDGDGAFWSGEPRLYDFSQQQQHQTRVPVAVPPSPAAAAPCLLTLQCCGVGWGVRKRVRYVGIRNRARHALSPPLAGDRSAVPQGDEESSTKAKEKKIPVEQEVPQESAPDDRKVAMPEKRKIAGGRDRASTKRPRKFRQEEDSALPDPKAEQAEEEEKAAASSGMVDRWKAGRYAIAEASLFGIMRARGARAGKPIPRGELRKEARAHIGDTGLLDHLLRHIADKLAPGRAERFRRRHNADGTLEYWLEPAELVAVRREAGVTDPYWVPPPGWKPGDPVSPEAYAMELKRQVEQLATELTGVKRHMEHLNSNVMQVRKEMKSEAEKSYNSWQGKYAYMAKANGSLQRQILSLEEKYENARQANGELKEELLFLKEKYIIVVEENTRLEQQMAALSTSFLSLKEDLLWLNTAEQQMMAQEQADLYVKEPWKDDKQDGNAGKATDDAAMDAGNQPAVDGDDASNNSNGTDGRGSGKRTSRKCSVRICKPQGTFQWPSMAFSPELAHPSPLTPSAEVAVAGADALPNFATMDELYEYMLAGGLPTPPSASSTNGGKLPFLPAPPSPASNPHDLHHARLRHTDTSAPCGASLQVDANTAALGAGAGGGNVGTELALATPTY